MSINCLTTFAPSKKPYSLALDRFETNAHGKSTVPAIWVGRKDGLTYVCEGVIWGYGGPGGFIDVADFMARFDARHGGDFRFRWNGHDLYAPQTAWSEQQSAVPRLGSVLNALPSVPAGYDGWFSLR